MTTTVIQTFVLCIVLLCAVLVAVRVLRKQVNANHALTPEMLTELQQQVGHFQAENSTLKQEIAAANSTINHLSIVETKVQDLQNSQSCKDRELSDKQVEITRLTTLLDEKTQQLKDASEDFTLCKNELQAIQQHHQTLTKQSAEQSEKLNQLHAFKTELGETKQLLSERAEQITELKAQLSADVEAKQALQEKIALLESAEKRLVTQFENTANKIFKEKTGEFNQQNKTSLDAVLSPLKVQIGEFSKQVSEVYTNEAKERHALKEEVSGLKALNQQMSKEATALTLALKGDNKKQGTWGEVVLERVLQESGLRKGHEYQTQKNLKGEGGATFKPDVIVHLPGQKDVVIDSKMALTAYERYFNAQDEVTEIQAIKEHVSAIKKHIKALSDKNYQDLHGIKTLDYILMFIPVEPAFNTAIEHDPEIIQLALSNNIMLVSPTNLMVALKTINNMWRVEYQNVNAQEIAKKAGAIYDKLVGFVEDMNRLGNHIQRAEGSYNDAMKKLSSGTGNLIRRAEQMKDLRIGNNKSLPDSLIEQSALEEVSLST